MNYCSKYQGQIIQALAVQARKEGILRQRQFNDLRASDSMRLGNHERGFSSPAAFGTLVRSVHYSWEAECDSRSVARGAHRTCNFICMESLIVSGGRPNWTAPYFVCTCTPPRGR